MLPKHAAVAAMITAGQNEVRRMVAVSRRGPILPPCGRCREFISQLAPTNLDTEVLVSPDQVVTLRDLLPFDSRSVQTEHTT